MSHSRQLPPGANLRRSRNQANDSIHKELRHRGEPLVEYPGAELWKAVGGSDGVRALINGICGDTHDDEERIARGSVIFDDLYSLFRKKKSSRAAVAAQTKKS